MCNEHLHQTQSRELMNMKLNQLPGSTTVILHCAWNFTEILSTNSPKSLVIYNQTGDGSICIMHLHLDIESKFVIHKKL